MQAIVLGPGCCPSILPHDSLELRRDDCLLILGGEIQRALLEWVGHHSDDLIEGLFVCNGCRRRIVDEAWRVASSAILPAETLSLHVKALDRDPLRRCVHQVEDIWVHFELSVCVLAEIS